MTNASLVGVTIGGGRTFCSATLASATLKNSVIGGEARSMPRTYRREPEEHPDPHQFVQSGVPVRHTRWGEPARSQHRRRRILLLRKPEGADLTGAAISANDAFTPSASASDDEPGRGQPAQSDHQRIGRFPVRRPDRSRSDRSHCHGLEQLHGRALQQHDLPRRHEQRQRRRHLLRARHPLTNSTQASTGRGSLFAAPPASQVTPGSSKTSGSRVMWVCGSLATLCEDVGVGWEALEQWGDDVARIERLPAVSSTRCGACASTGSSPSVGSAGAASQRRRPGVGDRAVAAPRP